MRAPLALVLLLACAGAGSAGDGSGAAVKKCLARARQAERDGLRQARKRSADPEFQKAFAAGVRARAAEMRKACLAPAKEPEPDHEPGPAPVAPKAATLCPMRPDCSIAPAGCSYDGAQPDADGCVRGCGTLTCNDPPNCPHIDCPPLKEGCRYMSEHGDALSCVTSCNVVNCTR